MATGGSTEASPLLTCRLISRRLSRNGAKAKRLLMKVWRAGRLPPPRVTTRGLGVDTQWAAWRCLVRRKRVVTFQQAMMRVTDAAHRDSANKVSLFWRIVGPQLRVRPGKPRFRLPTKIPFVDPADTGIIVMVFPEAPLIRHA
eukprot:6405376-Amphidinium_carterae.1